MRYIILIIILSCSVSSFAQTSTEQLRKILNWQPDPNNICFGNFIDPPWVAEQKPSEPLATSKTTITAAAPSTFKLSGESRLSGNVTIKQPGRLLRAQEARIQRPANSDSISTIDLRGNVRYNEMHQQLAGERVFVNLQRDQFSLWQGAYRLERPYTPWPLQAWGTAQAIQGQDKIMKIERATYTTCPLCEAPLWQLKAQKLDIDQNKGQAVARNVTLEIKDVPILYSPYLSYSIDKQRKTGFLFPIIGYNHHDGATIMQPYYLNLAPNYDATITPTFYESRGFALNNDFRYLTQNSFGNLYAAIIPHDREFEHYQDTQLNLPETIPSTLPYVTQLEKYSTTRWQFSGQHYQTFNPHMTSSAIVNWVSDDYYLQDFGQGPINTNTTNLLNQFNMTYDDDVWHMLARAQVYETLHPLYSDDTGNLYNRLPQLLAEGDWVTGCNQPRYLISTEYINFDQKRNFVTDQTVISGQRLDIHPGIALPLKNSYAFFTPRIDLDYTNYWLRDTPVDTPDQISRFLPISTLDMGLFLERHTQLFNCNFTQTLEPRAYYVYIPKSNQNDIPLFDTYLPTYSYEQLFQPNRYTGIDRINNANQITFALTSRFLHSNDGSERLLLLLATQVYFEDDLVAPGIIDSSDSYTDSLVSPLIFAANYHFTHNWSSIFNYVWNPSNQATTSTNTYIYYHGEGNRLFALGYDFVRGGDEYLDDPNSNLSRADLMFATPITESWSLFGNFNYNLSHHHAQYGMAGLEYQGCCFALRTLASRTAINESKEGGNNYDNRFYIQIDLKGLAKVGNSSPDTILRTRLPGFRDYFSG